MERLLARRGLTSYPLRPIHRLCDENDLAVLRGSGSDQTAEVYTAFNARDWSSDTPEHVITLATDEMILKIPHSSKTISRLDIACITRPGVTQAICERLFKAAPDMTVISTVAQDGLTMHESGRLIYIDPMNPPWVGEAEYLNSQQLADKIIAWIGAKQASQNDA